MKAVFLVYRYKIGSRLISRNFLSRLIRPLTVSSLYPFTNFSKAATVFVCLVLTSNVVFLLSLCSAVLKRLQITSVCNDPFPLCYLLSYPLLLSFL